MLKFIVAGVVLTVAVIVAFIIGVATGIDVQRQITEQENQDGFERVWGQVNANHAECN